MENSYGVMRVDNENVNKGDEYSALFAENEVEFQ